MPSVPSALRPDSADHRHALRVLASLALPTAALLPIWVLVLVETAFAMVSSLLADAVRLRPAGPFFFIFALGATATAPAGLTTPLAAIGLCAGTALLAILIGTIGTPHPPAGRPWLYGIGQVLRRPAPGIRVHAVRYGLAVGTAGGLGLALGVDHANWAMAAAAVPLAAIDGGRARDGWC
ncbi:hypothetical protein [Gordonia sp. VNK21]|uniref:hypothetical protein n=1 Tax=Gordonia sp. VNK21 TaxID=3382483 RepID=UPI0038D46C25